MNRELIMRRETGDWAYGAGPGTVRYVQDEHDGEDLLGCVVLLNDSALPVPPPDTIRVSLVWTDAGAGERRSPAQRSAKGPGQPSASVGHIQKGDRVTVVKRRVTGPRNPPEWLEQYVGRTGKVLWTTADGAMVDLDPDTTWFAFDELRVMV